MLTWRVLGRLLPRKIAPPTLLLTQTLTLTGGGSIFFGGNYPDTNFENVVTGKDSRAIVDDPVGKCMLKVNNIINNDILPTSF